MPVVRPILIDVIEAKHLGNSLDETISVYGGGIGQRAVDIEYNQIHVKLPFQDPRALGTHWRERQYTRSRRA